MIKNKSERFSLSVLIENTYLVYDSLNDIQVTFTGKLFNETQKVTLLSPVENPAHAMREIGDWLAENHSDKIC